MKIIDLMTVLFAAVGIMGTAVAGTGTSNEFRVDTRTGDRVSAGMEELTFSNLWDGDADATVTIAQDGTAIFEGLSGEGEKTWTVDQNGRYELTHATYANGVVAKVETAVFVVDGKEQSIGVPEITGLTARQRYPWNGLVDIECDIAYGDANANLWVAIVATNAATGVALPVKTVHVAGDEGMVVKAGHCAFVWDAGVDVPDVKIDDVALTVSASLGEYGLSVRYYDVGSSNPYSTWCSSYSGFMSYFDSRTPALEGNSSYFGDTMEATHRNSGDFNGGILHGKYGDGSTEYFATYLTGRFMSETTGNYQFEVWGDDYVVLYIDGTLVCRSVWDDTGVGTIVLSKGMHEIAMASYEVTVGHGFRLRLKRPMDTSWAVAPMSLFCTTDGFYEYTGFSTQISLDTRTVRKPAASETITYNPAWGDGDSVTITLDGETIGTFTEAGETTVDTTGWSGGVHTLTHTSGGETLTAQYKTPFPSPVLSNLTAKQRYPWNGLVDIECDVAYGDADALLEVSIVATNLATMTELPVRTVHVADGDGMVVKAGHCAFVWDAGADVPNENARLSLSLSVGSWMSSSTAGAFAYYSFSGTCQDDSGHGHDLTNNGAVLTYDRFGIADSAYYFGEKGSRLTTENNDGHFELTVPFSFACWAKTSKGKDENSDHFWAYGQYPIYPVCKSSGEAGLGIKVGTDGVGLVEHAQFYQPEAFSYACDMGNGWNHVCVVVPDDRTAKVYLNGHLIGTASLSSRIKYFGVTGIGGSGEKSINWSNFTGSVDEVGVWDRVLSDSEVVSVAMADGLLNDTSSISTELTVDIFKGHRIPLTTETITYNPAWGDGDSVTIALDGETIGTFTTAGETLIDTTRWSGGEHTLTHTSGDETLTAQYVVTKARFPTDGTISENPVDPDSFSFEGVYDGEGHTIKTNELVAAFSEAIKGEVSVKYSLDGKTGWQPYAFEYTDAVSTSYWYKVSAVNYEDFVHEATVTITPKELTDEFIWLVLPAEDYVYDGLAKEPGVVAVDGDPSIITDADWDVSYTDNVNAGTATATFTGKGNYTGTCEETFEILKADNEWTTEPSIADWTYGEAASTPVSAAKVGTATVTYSSGSVPTMPGDYTATFTVAESMNYNELTKTVPFKVLPAEISYSVDNVTAEYDGHGHMLSPSVLVPPEGCDVKFAETSDGPWYSNLSYTNVCDARIVYFMLSATGYTSECGSRTVTITPKPLSVTADGKTQMYGEGAKALTYTTDGLVDGDSLAGALEREPGDGAGTYAILQGTLANPNYAIDYTGADYVITKATLPGGGEEPGEGAVPQGGLSKFDFNGVYDGDAHTIATNELVAAFETATGGEVEVLYSADVSGAPSGAWSHVAPGIADVGFAVVWYKVSSANYEDFVHSATVTITPKPLSVTADGKTQVYGEVAKALTYTADGLVDGDSLAGALEREPGDGAGTYAILQGTLSNPNYAIGYTGADYVITKATLPGGGEEPGEGTVPQGGLSKFDFNGVYDGDAHTIATNELVAAFETATGGEVSVLYAADVSGAPSGAWSPVAPGIADVGSALVWYKVSSANYEDFVHSAKVTIAQKEVTDEMVQPGEDAFFYDGDAKKPTVDVLHMVGGRDVCTEADYDLEYGEKAASGWWVTVTGKGNYTGKVTKIVPVLKRPVVPPVVPSKAYNGKTQKPNVPIDSRWTVVSNPGGVEVGEYTNVVLRLTDASNYKWKGGAEDESDVTLVFKVTKANNGWSRTPDMKGWAYGETPNEPAMGQARYGTVQVAFRREGADLSTETSVRPELPGKYIARFWVDESDDYIGVALTTHKEIAFEITGEAGENTATETTPVPVPYAWLEPYKAAYGHGDYEAAGNATGANGLALWQSYVAGLDPADPTSQFIAKISIDADGNAVVTWSPDLSKAEPPRTYTIYGKASLAAPEWKPVTDANRAEMRFFKVEVKLK